MNMNLNKDNIKNVGGILLILVAIFVSYQFFVKQDTGSQALLLLQNGEAGPETKIVQGLFKILQDLNAIKIDTSLFADPLYLGLKDFSVTLISQEKGRPNPFAPFEGSAPVVSTGKSIVR